MNENEMKKDKVLYNNSNYNRDLLSTVTFDKRKESIKTRSEINNKKYLGEIMKEEAVEFTNNNLILAPVGSGKSHLIEKMLIPENYKKKILYLTSNTSLKDSLAPNDNKLRKMLAKNNQSVKFYTSENKKRYGDKPYNVHVMTYHEFGARIWPPNQTFTDDVELIFCDEVHSLATFLNYAGNGDLKVAIRWLFTKHENIRKYYFTATDESIEKLEKSNNGFLDRIKTFNYLEHPEIRKYKPHSVYYITHIEQIRTHFRARLESIQYHGHKGLAFTKLIKEQKKLAEIAKEEGLTPLILWSTNNQDEKMSEEQLKARSHILNTGHIPEPYDLLIINGSMQEGWNLHDDKVMFAIIDTLDKTEQIQSLGRIRKDIELVVYKTDDEKLISNSVVIKPIYLNKELTKKDKDELCEELEIINSRGKISKWRETKSIIEKSGYTVEDKTSTIDSKRIRVSIITKKNK